MSMAAGIAAGAVKPAHGQTVSAAAAVAAADIVLRNGKVIAVDGVSTVTQAIAVAGDRIIAVGPNETMAPHAGPMTRIIDLKGKSVIPVITD